MHQQREVKSFDIGDDDSIIEHKNLVFIVFFFWSGTTKLVGHTILTMMLGKYLHNLPKWLNTCNYDSIKNH